jgi:hypothetical protein
LHFNDDRSFHLNFLPRLIGRSLAPLREKDLFATVRLDPRRRALLWANGTEMDSATLRTWHAASRRPISGDKPLPPE